MTLFWKIVIGWGMASVVFSKPEDAREAVATAVRNAKLIGRHTGTPVTLAPVELMPFLAKRPKTGLLWERGVLYREKVRNKG